MRKMFSIGIVAVLGGGLLLAQSARTAEVELKAAQRTAEVKGDLKDAIRQYSAIAAKYAKSNRSVAATALLQMAECHLKIGDAEAHKIYEQVVREYTDQKEAVAEARARLGNARQQRQTSTLLWLPSKSAVDASEGRISSDGRYLSFIDWDTGDLELHDFATGADRSVTNQNAGKNYREFAEESAISRDGRRIAFTWGNDKDNRAELRVANLTGEFKARPLYNNPETSWISVFDWSPDDKLLAVQILRKDRTNQLGLLSAADGSLRVLKSIDWRGARDVFFAPGGKYIGYDLPEGDTGEQRDVFVMSVDGGEEIHAVANSANDLMMGWSPDGKWLLFASDRTGSTCLWGLPFADGKTQGSPRMLRSDLPAQASPVGVTKSGSMYYFRAPFGDARSKVFTVAFDFAMGRFSAAPKEIVRDYGESDSAPAWFPDGERLSYSVRRGPAREALLAVRSVATGEVREIRPKLAWFDDGRWSSDGRWFLTRGQDLKGRWGIFQVDARTGDALPLVVDQEGETNLYPVWAPDGKSFFFPRDYRATKERAAIQRDLASSREHVLIRGRYVYAGGNVSPDGRFAVAGEGDPATNSKALLLISLQDGGRRELMRMPSEAPPGQFASSVGVSFSNVSWAPDSRSFLVWKKRQGPTGSELWQIFTDGRQPRRVEAPALAVASNLPFIVNPDGKTLAFRYTERTPPREEFGLWALDHFLPESAAK